MIKALTKTFISYLTRPLMIYVFFKISWFWISCLWFISKLLFIFLFLCSQPIDINATMPLPKKSRSPLPASLFGRKKPTPTSKGPPTTPTTPPILSQPEPKAWHSAASPPSPHPHWPGRMQGRKASRRCFPANSGSTTGGVGVLHATSQEDVVTKAATRWLRQSCYNHWVVCAEFLAVVASEKLQMSTGCVQCGTMRMKSVCGIVAAIKL